MFYEHPSFRQELSDTARIESALVTLTPSESKRLIARAVAVLPEVRAALHKGTLVIGWGTTNAFVAEEIQGSSLEEKSAFFSGVVAGGELNANHPDTKIFPIVLQDGKPSEAHQKAALRSFMPGDVFIKGANAIDSHGDIAILLAAETGGSASDGWYATTIRGGTFICPVGLEKLIPSVSDVAAKCGVFRFKYSLGVPVSLITFSIAKVVTEIQAIQVLSGARASHVASGGIGGSEGAVTLVLEAEADALDRAFEIVKGVKGEPPLDPPRRYAAPSAASVGYDPNILREALQPTDTTQRVTP
jgi:hypothetical protein